MFDAGNQDNLIHHGAVEFIPRDQVTVGVDAFGKCGLGDDVLCVAHTYPEGKRVHRPVVDNQLDRM